MQTIVTPTCDTVPAASSVQLKQRTKFMRVYSDAGLKYLKEVVVLGDTGTGKTMLLSRLQNNGFDELHKSTM